MREIYAMQKIQNVQLLAETTSLEVFLPNTIILGYALHVAKFIWNIE